MQNSKNQTIRQSMTYNTIRGQFLQDHNWSRFRPTELHNFAKNVGVLGKRKSLKCLIFRDLPNLKSLKSGATRNRIYKFKILNYSTLISLEKSPNHWISHMPNSPIFDRFSLIILWLYKGKCSVLFLQIFIWLFRGSYKLFYKVYLLIISGLRNVIQMPKLCFFPIYL